MPTLRWGAALLLLPLAACNPNPTPFAATVPQPMPTAPTASAQDQTFAQGAARSDQFEIQSSQLALQKSRNRQVRAFAQRMIDDHTASSQKLTAIAGAKGIASPPTLQPNQSQMMATLQGATRNFDAQYKRAQIAGHLDAVSIHQAEIAGGYDADIRGFAQQMLPTIQGHLQMAQQLPVR